MTASASDPGVDAPGSHLLARADALQAEGLALLERLDLPALFADVGRVLVVGSVVSGLMTWRDLDVTLLAGPAFSPRDVVRLLDRMLDLPEVMVVGFTYRDERGPRTPAEQRDERYHVPIDVVPTDGDAATPWRIDLSVFLHDLHEQARSYHEELRDRLTPEERLAVLEIKDAWCRRPEYPDEVGGYDIYQAVLHYGVRTPAEFGPWLRSAR